MTRALVLVLLAVLGLGSGCSATVTPAPPPTCTLPEAPPTLAPGSLRLPHAPSVLVLGDSYTEGLGAVPATRGWAYLIAKPLGWHVAVEGAGGTGYLNAGPHDEGTYLQRLRSVEGRTFDLVVLQGGSNDRDASYLALQDAVSRTVDAVRSQFPGTAVVLLGPATPYGKPDPTRLLAQCVLAGHAARQQLPFVDPIGERWFVDGDGDRYANPENGHPSNAGYRHMAQRFVTDARVLLGRAKPS